MINISKGEPVEGETRYDLWSLASASPSQKQAPTLILFGLSMFYEYIRKEAERTDKDISLAHGKVMWQGMDSISSHDGCALVLGTQASRSFPAELYSGGRTSVSRSIKLYRSYRKVSRRTLRGGDTAKFAC